MSITSAAPANVETADPQSAETKLANLLQDLRERLPELEIHEPSAATRKYGVDWATQGELRKEVDGPAVAVPASVTEVQEVVRAAAAHGVSIVPRGAGSGLAGGARATANQLVLTTERLNRILEVSPLDELAVVEPGVLNKALNEHLEPFGLFYAPDPASWDISTIGGNVATNAGGLRCVKYGVTRESILALDLVLADGERITVGQRSIKGVTGLDLRSLLIGSEGILAIVVGITVRLRPIPVARQTVSVAFEDTISGAKALAAITRSAVRPSVIEFIDGATLEAIDRHSGTNLSERGGALALIELDGFGIQEQFAQLDLALRSAGGKVRAESAADAEVLWELRRNGRGFPSDEWFVTSDIAVPKSKIADVFAHLPELEARFGVKISAVAHAGDGNLHPGISLRIPEGADPSEPDPVLHEAMDALVDFALSLGGTITGEHGLGTIKREYAATELSARNLKVQRAIKRAFDPQDLLNPGKAI
ncbi:FAD-binding oxidoreductase [Gulosibacter chungangensis]|uniref:FAD-binding protein n=1 Tax=Gulosibacter chungangensis TaxID=979746 RepID=A0A7J5BC16_9MICO|nr:FAD-linked oxidase C-terminal domain-containing protein [Gulosibacter chungangensis]KAB1643645.1 FAD-binding protein [Gulosibacter chungangensis]